MLKENRKKGHRIAAIIGSMLIASPLQARAQPEGRVAGRVVDQTGAVLPGVTIELVVNATELTATSDNEGCY